MNLNEILEDPGISCWLKDAMKAAYERDPVEALHDARRLLKMLGERYTRIVNRVDSRHFDGRVVFVPEGQHDSSQARSAWNHQENNPVPAGRLNHDDDFDRPSRTGLSALLPRHFVPGYDQPVPPGQKPFAYRSGSQLF